MFTKAQVLTSFTEKEKGKMKERSWDIEGERKKFGLSDVEHTNAHEKQKNLNWNIWFVSSQQKGLVVEYDFRFSMLMWNYKTMVDSRTNSTAAIKPSSAFFSFFLSKGYQHLGSCEHHWSLSSHTRHTLTLCLTVTAKSGRESTMHFPVQH